MYLTPNSGIRFGDNFLVDSLEHVPLKQAVLCFTSSFLFLDRIADCCDVMLSLNSLSADHNI